MVRRLGAILGMSVVNAKWTSYGALEVDVFADTKADFQTFQAALEPLVARIEFARDLQEPQPFSEKARAVREAAALFNAERFWEAHEVLEALWRVAEQTDEKRLLQGLILVCAALVHLQKDEPIVAIGVARRALPQLAWRARVYHGIDVNALRERLSNMLREGALAPPKI